MISLAKDTFIKPIDLIENETKENNFGLSWIILAIGAVCAGIFTTLLSKTLYTSIIGMFGMGSMYGSMGINIDIPYFKIFMIVLIAYSLCSLLFSSVAYLVFNKIFKGKISFKESFVLYQMSSIILIATLLIASLLSFVSLTVAVIVMILGLLLRTVYLLYGYINISNLNKNYIGYGYLLVISITTLVEYIVAKIFN